MPTPAYGPLLDALRGLKWPARRPVGGALPGVHRSRLRGSAPEFSEYRPYRQGDDPRRLDWRLLARSDRAYIRLAEDHAIVPTVLVVDASASMAYPASSLAKWVRARELAVGLAAVAHAAGDPIGVLVTGVRGVVRLAPRARRGVVGEVARTLDGVAPGGATALEPLLAAIAPAARVAVVSDFLGDADALLRAARARIAAGGDVVAVHVVADEELDPPRRAVLAEDPEAPALRRPLTDASRDAYLAAFGAWRETLARDWRGAGASYVLVATGEPAAHAVRRIVTPMLPQAVRA
ncbi:MAG TPA: DUF58 domain-containing protein [Gemmatimonadaceae bacterium]|nr:DUF58 domain-containing protein [Gemmatimonadaceae bacterium]